MSQALLEVRNLETAYGPVSALRGVGLDVPRGGIVTVLGANGAGKSTLLRTVSGLLTPEKGTIRLEGESIEGRDPAWIARRGVAHVPEGRQVFPFLSVRENLLLGAYTRRDSEGIHGDLKTLFDHFPVLRERSEQRALSLSGGEQQMLVIARALMSRPRLMLLDEPSLGLSPRLVGEIFGILKGINERQGLSILLVEQNARKALQTAHYGYVLEVGRIVLEGPVEVLLEKDDIREFYLGIREKGVRPRRRWKRRKSWR